MYLYILLQKRTHLLDISWPCLRIFSVDFDNDPKEILKKEKHFQQTVFHADFKPAVKILILAIWNFGFFILTYGRGGTINYWGNNFDAIMPTQRAIHGGAFTLTISIEKMVKSYLTILAFWAFICVLSNATFLLKIVIYRISFPW